MATQASDTIAPFSGGATIVRNSVRRPIGSDVITIGAGSSRAHVEAIAARHRATCQATAGGVNAERDRKDLGVHFHAAGTEEGTSNTTLTVLQLLQAVNAKAVNGVLYATAGSNGNTLIGMVNTDFSNINQQGDIV